MSTDPEFTEALREAGARIGEILTEDLDRQRRGLHDSIRTMLEVARTRVGGEFAGALLNVLLVADKWAADAQAFNGPYRRRTIDPIAASDEILTAIESGLALGQQS